MKVATLLAVFGMSFSIEIPKNQLSDFLYCDDFLSPYSSETSEFEINTEIPVVPSSRLLPGKRVGEIPDRTFLCC
jgi:hypothetical protein